MGFFSKIASAFRKTKEAIGNKIMSMMSKGELDDEFFEELEFLLISADVGAEASQEIVENLRAYSRKQKLRNQEDVKNALKKIISDILNENKPKEVEYPALFMVVGVNGVGKTTTIGKLANFYKNENKNVLLVAGDTFRAAAAEQLTEWANRNKTKIVKNNEGSDPASVVFDGIKSAKAKANDVVIVDTAGRLHNKVNLMEELKKISRIVEREWNGSYQKLLVLDATTGQNALSQVEYFSEAIGIDGLVLTKLDGTAKGGVIIAIAKQYKVPVCFVGTGEGLEDIEPFDATEFADAIL